MPVAERHERGLPGARSFTMSETFGGSLEAKAGGGAEKVEDNIRHEAAEEVGIDASQFRVTRLFESVAVSPDRSTGVAHGVVLETTRPVKIDAAALAEPKSGEVAETGARVLPRVPIGRALRYLQSGQIIDGRTALLLLSAAYRFKWAIDPALAEPPSPAERHVLRRDFDPERGDVRPTEYAKVDLLPTRDPAAFRGGERFDIASRRVRFRTGDRKKERVDPHEHKTAIFADQVSELPVVYGKDGTLYVGLVPSASAGVLGRRVPEVAAKIPVDPAAPPDAIQQRGLVRDVRGYRAALGARGGNLGVEPIYDGSLSTAYAALARAGLSATANVRNLGQFNASVGENGYHMNLTVREFRAEPGRDPAVITLGGAIKFVPLHEAIEHAMARPNAVDQMTQVQLLLLALSRREGFQFRAAR
jgi:hypothetical protein